jgi:hypothetical protein
MRIPFLVLMVRSGALHRVSNHEIAETLNA